MDRTYGLVSFNIRNSDVRFIRLCSQKGALIETKRREDIALDQFRMRGRGVFPLKRPVGSDVRGAQECEARVRILGECVRRQDEAVLAERVEKLLIRGEGKAIEDGRPGASQRGRPGFARVAGGPVSAQPGQVAHELAERDGLVVRLEGDLREVFFDGVVSGGAGE